MPQKHYSCVNNENEVLIRPCSREMCHCHYEPQAPDKPLDVLEPEDWDLQKGYGDDFVETDIDALARACLKQHEASVAAELIASGLRAEGEAPGRTAPAASSGGAEGGEKRLSKEEQQRETASKAGASLRRSALRAP